MKSVLIFIFFFTSIQLFSQPGTLDKTFNDSGKVHISDYLSPVAMGIQNGDNILIAGSKTTYTIGRYTNQGLPDSSFGENGLTIVNNITEGEARSLKVLENKKILSCGNSQFDIAVVQLKENGKLDSSFGINGLSVIDLGGSQGGSGLAVQNDHKIVVCGTISFNIEQGYKLFVLRLNSDGSLDKSFGTNGYIINQNAFGLFSSIDIQPDQKIVTAASYWQPKGGKKQFVVSRYNTDGSMDATFGENGNVFTDISSVDDIPYTVKILSDGKIVAAGQANYGQSIFVPSYMAVVKYDADGNPDNGFGQNGVATVTFNDTSSQATGLLLQADGKLIITGSATKIFQDESIVSGFALARLNINGTLDSSFASNGKQVTYFGEISSSSASVMQPDGKMVLSGSGYPNDTTVDLLLARYNTGQTNKQQIITKIRHYLQNHHNGIVWDKMPGIRSYTVERSTDNVHFSAVTTRQINTNEQPAESNYYEDLSPTTGTNYYRVQTTSVDGAVAHSNTLAIQSAVIASNISIYPNPVKDVLHVQNLDQSTSYVVTISNEKGIAVSSSRITKKSEYSVSVANFKSGLYHATVVSENFTFNAQFLKQ